LFINNKSNSDTIQPLATVNLPDGMSCAYLNLNCDETHLFVLGVNIINGDNDDDTNQNDDQESYEYKFFIYDLRTVSFEVNNNLKNQVTLCLIIVCVCVCRPFLFGLC
jgi:hypothetical protein